MMGLRDLFNKEKEKKQPLLEIAELVSAGDENVLEEVTRCITDIGAYFEAHREQYEERGIEEFEDKDMLRWLGLVDCLEKNGYVCERDWKDEKRDFTYFLQNLKGVKEYGLEVHEEWFQEGGV